MTDCCVIAISKSYKGNGWRLTGSVLDVSVCVSLRGFDPCQYDDVIKPQNYCQISLSHRFRRMYITSPLFFFFFTSLPHDLE